MIARITVSGVIYARVTVGTANIVLTNRQYPYVHPFNHS